MDTRMTDSRMTDSRMTDLEWRTSRTRETLG